MGDLSTNLTRLIKEHGLSELELSRRTKVSQPVVNRLVSGKTPNPKISTLKSLADYFGISIDRLVGHDTSFDTSMLNPAQTIAVIPHITIEDAVHWPTRKSAPIKQMLTDVRIGPNGFAIQLPDNAMSPQFPTGTMIIADPQADVNDHDFVIVQRAGSDHASLKQLLIDGKDRYLKSINPDLKTHPLTPNDRIVGVMLQARLSLDG